MKLGVRVYQRVQEELQIQESRYYQIVYIYEILN